MKTINATDTAARAHDAAADAVSKDSYMTDCHTQTAVDNTQTNPRNYCLLLSFRHKLHQIFHRCAKFHVTFKLFVYFVAVVPIILRLLQLQNDWHNCLMTST